MGCRGANHAEAWWLGAARALARYGLVCCATSAPAAAPEHDEVSVQAVQAVPHVGRVVGAPLLQPRRRGGAVSCGMGTDHCTEACNAQSRVDCMFV